MVIVDLFAAGARGVLCSIADFFRLEVQRLVISASPAVRMDLNWLDESIAAQTLSWGTGSAYYTRVTSVSLVTIATRATTRTRITCKSL